MAMMEGKVFIDTNVLIYANLALSPFHRHATERLQRLDEQNIELWISRQTLREYLAVMTRPGDLTGTIPIKSLLEDVQYFAARFRVAEDGPFVTERLLSLLELVACGGKQIHDANIAATMLAHDVDQLLTHNTSDFTRFSAYITVLPLIATS